jgi:hypothetical protein
MTKNNCAIDQTELETLSGEFADEALEIAMLAGGDPQGSSCGHSARNPISGSF